jgi:type III pantothenate kinase
VANKVIAIDAGNTRTKWGVHDGTAWVRHGSFSTGEPQGLAAEFSALVADAIVISHVADASSRERLRAALPSEPMPHWIKSLKFQCGVHNHYEDPAQLGCDRWAALLGARRLHAGAAVVANAGTALTVDALTQDGHFIGGIIAPGLRLMRQALAQNTAALPLETGAYSAFPVRTVDAISSGGISALCGAIERIARLLHDAGHTYPLCLLSGGDAPQITPLLNLEVQVVDNLVLEGLLSIAWDDLEVATPH